jgi:hypothetical protein
MWRLTACAALALCAGCSSWDLFTDDTKTFFTRPMPDAEWQAAPAAQSPPAPEATGTRPQPP